jgi:hypothetical protein
VKALSSSVGSNGRITLASASQDQTLKIWSVCEKEREAVGDVWYISIFFIANFSFCFD